ncbi:hypothetical protein Avbf_13415 [Armadillidium vulgare]|nr:hypothetical protein Avbf_13415 [Armadillidium vulgare]
MERSFIIFFVFCIARVFHSHAFPALKLNVNLLEVVPTGLVPTCRVLRHMPQGTGRALRRRLELFG